MNGKGDKPRKNSDRKSYESNFQKINWGVEKSWIDIIKEYFKKLFRGRVSITTLDELIELKYGKIGTPKRDKFEVKSKKFIEKELKKIKEQ